MKTTKGMKTTCIKIEQQMNRQLAIMGDTSKRIERMKLAIKMLKVSLVHCTKKESIEERTALMIKAKSILKKNRDRYNKAIWTYQFLREERKIAFARLAKSKKRDEINRPKKIARISKSATSFLSKNGFMWSGKEKTAKSPNMREDRRLQGWTI